MKRTRITAPLDPKPAQRAKLRDEVTKAKGRGKGETRTPAEVDALLDLLADSLEGGSA